MRLAYALILAPMLSACGPRAGDVYEDIATGERIAITDVGECGTMANYSQSLYAAELAHDVASGRTRSEALERPAELPHGAERDEPCYAYRTETGGMPAQHLGRVSEMRRFKKLN